MSSVPASALTIDLAAEAERLAGELRRYVLYIFKRYGGVIASIAVSGDAATVLALRTQETGMPGAEVATCVHLDEAAALRAFRDFERKRQTTTRLRPQPVFFAEATPDDDERP